MPGGISRPVRAFNIVGDTSVIFEFVKVSKGYVVDVMEYTDYTGSWGPAVVGAASDDINVPSHKAVQKETSSLEHSVLENQFAKMFTKVLLSVEMFRFVNSGTKALMSVVHVMHTFTLFQMNADYTQCFKGHVDMYLIQVGSHILALGLPDSPGVPEADKNRTTNPKYDCDSLVLWSRKHGLLHDK